MIAVFTNRHFKGWGRKRTGRFALWCHKTFGGKLTLFEDGFIRSVGLGTEGAPSFSTVEDDRGIYYDASQPSQLEHILASYDFSSDDALMQKASKAMGLIEKYHISKYNDPSEPDARFCVKYGLDSGEKKRVLVIAQTAGDASLEYGLAGKFSTKKMINDALQENPDASVYLKVHPEVLSGKKRSDIDSEDIPPNCCVIEEEVNPVSLLAYFDKVYTKTSGMGMEALIAGKEVHCYGMPYYAGWGVTHDRQVCERRTRKLTVEELFAGAYILYTRYADPYTGEASDIVETIEKIVKENGGRSKDRAYFFGFSRWKQHFIRPFFPEYEKNALFFCTTLENALKKGMDKQSRIYIWGRRPFEEVERYAKEHDVNVFRVEDGFIRSVGLGSDLTQPYSQVVDFRGIYFDPAQESDLEYLLQNHDFANDPRLLERAKKIRAYLIEKKLSKYNMYEDVPLALPEDKHIVVVPGQVEDDASMRYGAKGMDNLTLLREVRKDRPEAYIIFKPHPDVLAGNRVGHIEESVALAYCDRIVTEVSLDSVLMYADEVHTMTSLVGFEALVRGIAVYTYGMPFYAGWGLSTDKRTCKRRTRQLKLDEMVAGVLLLYPRYLDPQSGELCGIERLLESLEAEKQHYARSGFYRLSVSIRNFISRRSQKFLSFVKEV